MVDALKLWMAFKNTYGEGFVTILSLMFARHWILTQFGLKWYRLGSDLEWSALGSENTI